MKNLVVSLFIAAFSMSNSYATIPIFAEYDFNTLFIARTIESEIIKDGISTGNPLLGNEPRAFSSLFIDKTGNRASDTWSWGMNEPDPKTLRILNENTDYEISHPQKQVTIDQKRLDQLTLFFHLDGWYLFGKNLDQLVKSHLNKKTGEQLDGTWSFHVKPPNILEPVKFFMNQENQVMKTIVPYHENGIKKLRWQTVTIYSWSKVPKYDFWYPEMQQSTTTAANGTIMKTTITIQKIELNSKVPTGIFNTDHPDDYQVIDRRKMIKSWIVY